MLLSVKYSMVCSCITFSKILETIGRSEIGLKFLGSVLVPFLYKGLSLATLQSFGKWDSLMDKLQICVMGMPNTSTPFFKNLPDTLSILAALLTLHDFRRLQLVFGWTVWKFSLLWLNSNYHWNSLLQPLCQMLLEVLQCQSAAEDIPEDKCS